jgi:PAS domain S-box-containing protein
MSMYLKQQRMKVGSRIESASAFSELSLEQDEELQEALLLATNIFNTPGAALCFLDGDQLEIKLSTGLCKQHYSRLINIYNAVSTPEEILIVEDTTNDDRFATLPHMEDTETPRFYAASPLITRQGVCIGTLCVLDYVPHQQDAQHALSLKILAKHVISIMEAKLNLARLDGSFAELERARETAISNEIKLRALFESLTDVYVFLGMSGEILDFNQAAYKYILKFKGKTMIKGGFTADYLNEVDNAAFMTNFRSALRGERISQEMLSYGPLSERVWWDSIFEPVRNTKGEMMGVSYIARNINKRKMDSVRILNQNKILKDIANIHAHEYRAPVCAIMGIMNLIEADDYAATKEYLLMLQKAVKELDAKTHAVIKLVSDLNMVSMPASNNRQLPIVR